MRGIHVETKIPDFPPRPEAPTELPAEGGPPTLANPPFRFPSLGPISTAWQFAKAWDELHPEILLIPLRRSQSRPDRGRWVPSGRSWERPPTSKELCRLLRDDRKLGIGLKLGRLGPGLPSLLDIVARNAKNSDQALRRMLDRQEYEGCLTWRDHEGAHRLFLGDDRLEGFGPTLVGAHRSNGLNPNYPALEIRSGPGGPATSLLVLPPTRCNDGTPRNPKGNPDRIQFLGDRFYADLGEFAVAKDGRPGPSGVPSTAPAGPAAKARRGRNGGVASPGCPAGVTAETEALPAPSPAGYPVRPPLSAPSEEADGINRSHRSGLAAACEALDHARLAGEGLIRVKAGLPHGQFQAWVKEHCEFSYRIAALYMDVCRNWAEVEEMRASKVKQGSLLTWSGFLKRKPRSSDGADPVALSAVVEAPDPAGPTASTNLPPAPDKRRRPGRVVGPVRAGTVDLAAPGKRDGEEARAAIRRPAGADSGPVLVVESDLIATSIEGNLDPSRPDIAVAGDREEVRADILPDDPEAGGLDPAASRGPESSRPATTGRGPTRARLEELGNVEDFDADARAWEMLRPLAEEISASRSLDGKVRGLYNEVIALLADARPPEEWGVCPACQGTGRVPPGTERCGPCLGAGYGLDIEECPLPNHRP